MLAERAAEDLHVRIGDRLTVRYPAATSAWSYQLASTTMPITGVSTSPLRFVVDSNQAALAWMGLSGLVNRMSVVPREKRR